MKKIKYLIFLITILLLVGCGKDSSSSIIKKFKNNIRDNSYKIEGVLSVVNNDDIYNYDIKVHFKKNNNYKVSLTNQSNRHEQIILKNSEGVYVITPSLNKSFKFQSEWPNTNSQIYLLQSIKKDIINDKNATATVNKDNYIIISKVNYPNNKKLVKQKITLDKHYNLKEVSILTKNDIPQMTMKFTNITQNANINNNEFKLDKIITIKNADDNEKDSSNNSENNTSSDSNTNDTTKGNNSNSSSDSDATGSQKNNDNSSNNTNSSSKNNDNEKTQTSSSLDDIIYPLYLPTNTKLASEETIQITNGQRAILTFEGDKSFILVEETAVKESNLTIIPTTGEPYMLADTIGALSNNSITWTSSGIDYYITSSVMKQDELVEVARSISSIPTMK